MNKKVILVTGTNSGFGWLHVHTLSAAGHTVYATMRNTVTNNKEKADALSKLTNVHVLDVNLTNANAVKNVISDIVAKEGRIDVVVNNAGNFMGGIAETFSDTDVQQLFDIHLKATWNTTREALPYMRRQGTGLIVNTSSVLGRFSAPFMTFYNAAKFAVEGLSEGLRYELRPLGIDVAIVQPGAHPTDIFAKSGSGSNTAISGEYGAIAQIPEQITAGMNHLLETLKPNPQHVADAVLELVEMPQGKRPLRTVVDAATGKFAEEANADVARGYEGFLSAFGLRDLLN